MQAPHTAAACLVLEPLLIFCITCCAEPLKDYVGPIGLYGHVNDILKENMSQMKVGGWQCCTSATSCADSCNGWARVRLICHT